MNKLIYLAGAIVAGFLIFQINSGNIVSNDVINVMEIDNPLLIASKAKVRDVIIHKSTEPAIGYFSAYADDLEKYFNATLLSHDFESDVRAAVLPYDLEHFSLLASFFSNLKLEEASPKTFVIFADNESLGGHFGVAISEYGYRTPYGDLEPDMFLAESIITLSTDNRVGSSYRAFHNDESISNLAPFIKKTFPDSKILAISIKGLLPDDYLSTLAEDLSPILSDEDIIVLAPSTFSKDASGLSALLHNDLANEVLESLDTEAIEDLDTNKKSNLRLLFHYLNSSNYNSASPYVLDSAAWTYHEGENESDRAVTILAFGDMMLGRYVRTLMDRNGMDYVFENIRGENNNFLSGSDFIFANLEGPIKGDGYNSGTSLRFGFNKDTASFLKKYGFNLLSISNNHAVDQGWNGRDTTISALSLNGISWCGHPSEADPNSVYYSSVGDKRVAVLCFQDVTYKLDDEAAANLIKSVKANVDYLIVSVHWGYEYKHRPDWNTQIDPGHAFIDAGADFIIGHHPHVVQSFEVYNGKFIFYSLGNFVFDQYWSIPTQEELALGIVLEDSDEAFTSKVYLFPMKSEKSQPRLMSDSEFTKWIEEFIDYGEYSEEMKEQIRAGVLSI